MLTGADLDTKHSLDGALVQISLPSQTQTSRQIAWANVIGVTSPNKKEKEKNKTKNTLSTATFREFSLIFSHYYHEKGGTKKKREEELKKSAELASLNYSDPHCQLDPSLALE